MSDERYKTRKQKIRHGGGGKERRKIKPKHVVKVYEGRKKAA